MENNIETNINVEFNNTENEKNNLIQDFVELITQKIQQQKQGQQEPQQQKKQEQQHENHTLEQQIEIQEEKTLVIDRFEGKYAVCENRETQEMENIEISKLPQNIKQGDVIKSKNNQYEVDEAARAEIEERIKNKMKNLFNN